MPAEVEPGLLVKGQGINEVAITVRVSDALFIPISSIVGSNIRNKKNFTNYT